MLDGEVIQNMMFQYFCGQQSCTLNQQMKMIIIQTRYVITFKAPAIIIQKVFTLMIALMQICKVEIISLELNHMKVINMTIIYCLKNTQ